MSESEVDLTPKGLASRGSIITAASELFAAKGVKGASITEIASLAGVNRAMIAYYFGSKAGLYDAIIDEAVADATQALGDLDIDFAADEPERRLVLAFAEMLQRRPHFARMIVYEYFQPGRLFEPETGRKLAGMMALTEKVLAGIDLGPRARAYDPQVVHLICMGSLVYFALTEPFRSGLAGRLGRPISQPTTLEFAETLADMLCAGLRAGNSEQKFICKNKTIV